MKSGILLLSSEFPPQPGGVGNHACNLARVVHSAGHRVTVLTNSRGQDFEAEQAFDSMLPFPVWRVPRYRLAWFVYLKRCLAFFEFLFQNPRCTVIASGKFSLWLGALGRFFFPKNRYLAVVHGTEINPPGTLSKWLTNKSLTAFDQLVAVSNFTQNLVLKIHPNANVVVFHNGFDPKKFRPSGQEFLPKKHGCPTLLSIGNISRRKGQHNVVQALPTLRTVFPELRYHLVGLPTERERVEQLAEKLGVRAMIEFHGALDDLAVSELLQRSDVFILLSENTPDGDVEGFGIAILEANAAGLPAIGSTGCGIEDAIRDGFSGRLVDGQNVLEILAALEEIVENYETYAANARAWAAEFTWEKRGQAYLELISNLNFPKV